MVVNTQAWMCTVTLFPLSDSEKSFVLTSNRDEALARETFSPKVYKEEGVQLLYPKDARAGGTWIGLSDRKRAICLLNGGFEMHLPSPPYRKSRGEVVKDFLKTPELVPTLKGYNLENIEPFTSIVVSWAEELEFLELVWDGKQRHLRKLDHKGRIWSSASLYSPETIRQRHLRFEEFLKTSPCGPEKLLDFHTAEGTTEVENFMIDRGFLKTVSITQITRTSGGLKFRYRDTSSAPASETEFSLGDNLEIIKHS